MCQYRVSCKRKDPHFKVNIMLHLNFLFVIASDMFRSDGPEFYVGVTSITS